MSFHVKFGDMKCLICIVRYISHILLPELVFVNRDMQRFFA